jgi:DUF971 family protein
MIMEHPGQCWADPEHIAISRSGGVRIDWRDGHRSDYALAWLRDRCPCAGCTGAHGTPPQKMDPAANPFRMYRPALKIETVEPVGNYALRINWNDGHNAGIYSYDYLRRICPCGACGGGRIDPAAPTGAGS